MTTTTEGNRLVLDARLIHDVVRGDPWARKPRKGGLTASGLGVCERKGAYLDAGVPFSEPESDGHVTATMGNWLHDGLLPRLVQVLRANGQEAVSEVKVSWSPPGGGAPVRGRLDLADETDVYDLKTYSDWAFERFVEGGPKEAHRWQLLSYAAGRRQQGHPTERIHVIGMHRGTGDLHTWTADFSEAALEPLTAWLERVRYHAERDPDGAQREQGGPGVSKECDWCPFLTRCWGDGAEAGVPGPQAQPENAAAIASAGTMYLKAMAAERAASDDKKWARAILEGAPAGTYGPVTLGWRRGYTRKPALDVERATELLRFAGLEPPFKAGSAVAASPTVKATPDAPA